MTEKEYEDRCKKAAGLEVVAAGGTYSVRSSTGKGGYMVTESDGKLTCACTDFYMHIHQDPGWKCKHVIAAETFKEKKGSAVRNGSRFDVIDLS